MTQQMDTGWRPRPAIAVRRRGSARAGTRAVAATAALLVGVAILLAGTAPVGGGEPEGALGVRVTQVPATTADGASLLVSPPRDLSLLDLDEGDITVSDADGPVAVDVSRLEGDELDVAVVIDVGVTAAEAQQAVGAADELVRTLPPDARIAVITTGEDPVVDEALTDDRPAVLEAIAGLGEGAPGDDLVEAIRAGAFQLESAAGSRPTIVAVSAEPVDDGAALRAASRDARAPAALYLTATGPASPEVARVLEDTGGKAVVVDGAERLISATDEVTRELGAQYRVDVPPPAEEGTELTVQVAKSGVVAAQSITLATPQTTSTTAPAASGADTSVPAPDGEGGDPPSLVVIGILATVAGALIGAVGLALRRVRGTRGRRASAGEPGPVPPVPPPAATVPALPSRPDPPPPLPLVDLREPEGDGDGRTPASGVTIDLTDRPSPPPDRLELGSDLREGAQVADAALGELAGSVRSMPEGVVLDGFLLREAVASINRDGAEIALAEVFRARATLTGEANHRTDEVEGLVEAMLWGFHAVARGPLDRRVLTEVVARRAARDPARTSPDEQWRRGARGVSAPLSPGQVSSAALQAALARQVIDTGWPDAAARGWLGRAAVSLSLAHSGVLAEPLLELSAVPVPATLGAGPGRPEAPVQATLESIAAASTVARHRLDELLRLRASYMSVVAQDRPRSASALVDLLIANPVVTARSVTDAIPISHLGALNLIRTFSRRGWLRPTRSAARNASQLWVAPAILTLFKTDHPGPDRHVPDTEEHR